MNTLRRYAVPGGWTAALIIGLVVPFLVSDYDLLDLSRVLTLAMAVAGLNLLLGHSGQISVGHGAVFGLGGYVTLGTVTESGWPWVPAVLLSGAVCLVFGLLIGGLALKMGGANLGLLTIAVAAVFPLVIIRLKSTTGGTFGLSLAHSGIQPPPGTGLTPAQFGYVVCLLVLALTLVLLRNLVTGTSGRALAAVRTSPLLAAANGVNVNRVKLTAFAVSSAVAGIGGALYALAVAIAVPDSYQITLSITLLAAGVVGGSRTWAGAIVGAAIVVYLPTAAENVVSGDSSGNWAQLVYAGGLILCLILAPTGLVGGFTRLLGRFTSPSPTSSPSALDHLHIRKEVQ
ncbi:branched-chain amino acid ABC transporter permease [Streptomyces sp. NPDC002588]|uniref:branched-chain amino acid ABC transporter permease n=1 Tax=Streptomyces sp. NPDC002588 TaxID=3154419 RepID=UPI00331A3325